MAAPRIVVLAFASAADALGAAETTLEIAPGTTLAALRARLLAEHPGLAPLASRLAVAVNGEIVAGDRALADGDEVALLPPVSGGSPEAAIATPPAVAALTDQPIDAGAVLAAVADPGCGAALLFLGSVRSRHAGRDVEGIVYSAYRPMAAARLARIAEELAAGHPGLRVAIVHRLGALRVGEPSVAIAVASPHRDLAYDTSRRALERLKAEVPIWKRERYVGGEERWREDEPLRE